MKNNNNRAPWFIARPLGCFLRRGLGAFTVRRLWVLRYFEILGRLWVEKQITCKTVRFLVNKHAQVVDSTLAANISHSTSIFPPCVRGVFGIACGLLLVLLPAGGGRDVIEALAEGVVAYCQHLPPEERTVYLPAAGHSKVGGTTSSGNVLPTFLPAINSCAAPISSRLLTVSTFHLPASFLSIPRSRSRGLLPTIHVLVFLLVRSVLFCTLDSPRALHFVQSYFGNVSSPTFFLCPSCSRSASRRETRRPGASSSFVGLPLAAVLRARRALVASPLPLPTVTQLLGCFRACRETISLCWPGIWSARSEPWRKKGCSKLSQEAVAVVASGGRGCGGRLLLERFLR